MSKRITVFGASGFVGQNITQILSEEGFEVIEKRITRDEIYISDEAFFTGTAAEVTPIRELDNRQIGAGSIGPITRTLQQAYLDLAEGRRQGPSEWSTIVD